MYVKSINATIGKGRNVTSMAESGVLTSDSIRGEILSINDIQ